MIRYLLFHFFSLHCIISSNAMLNIKSELFGVLVASDVNITVENIFTETIRFVADRVPNALRFGG